MSEFNPLEDAGSRLIRWYERGLIQGAEYERERIVEVLQHKLDNALLPDGDWTLAFSYAIALIKEDFNE